VTVSTAAPDTLRRTEELLIQPLADAVGALPPSVQPVVAHHLGWTGPDSRRGTGGKAVRATLVLLSAEAAGGSVDVAIPGAVAIELVHNFSLLHDDVMDRDTERRHRPAAWTVFGEPLALLAGTSLVARAQAILASAGPNGPSAAACLEQAIQQLVTGQALDLSFERRDDVTATDWVLMVEGKTAALLEASTSIGAMLAGAQQPLLDALASYALHLGVAYQAVDDLLGIWGSPAFTGKPVGRDPRQFKKTLPVVAALAVENDAARQLRDLLGEQAGEEADVARMTALIEDNGGRDATEAEAARRVEAALEAIAGADVPAGVAADLTALALFATARDR
jgi:geranylgeranyl diphosphate synthase type I